MAYISYGKLTQFGEIQSKLQCFCLDDFNMFFEFTSFFCNLFLMTAFPELQKLREDGYSAPLLQVILSVFIHSFDCIQKSVSSAFILPILSHSLAQSLIEERMQPCFCVSCLSFFSCVEQLIANWLRADRAARKVELARLAAEEAERKQKQAAEEAKARGSKTSTNNGWGAGRFNSHFA